MTTDEVMQAVAARGLTLALLDGSPVVRGPKAMKTPALLKVLKHHREEIIARLKAHPPPLKVYEPAALEPPPHRQREFLTPVGGVVRSGEGWPDDYVEPNAWWWRFVGESEWRLTATGQQKGAGYPPTRAPILKAVRHGD